MDINRIRLVSLFITVALLIGLTLLAQHIPERHRPGHLHALKTKLKIERALLQVNRSELKVLLETDTDTKNQSTSSQQEGSSHAN